MFASAKVRERGSAKQKLCRACLLACASLFFSGAVLAQNSPQPSASTALGQIIGGDISVTGPSMAVHRAAEAIVFFSGSEIVVHSGKARVEFIGGGELDVCGPAKFTVLSSGEAITIALSFGRVHLRFDAARPVTIYTPMILATPIPIADDPRDDTVGLANSGAMCVLATHGAVRLQNQLSGESTIVPQPSEILLANPSFANLPVATGQCRCDFDQPVATAPNPPSSEPARFSDSAPSHNPSGPPESSRSATQAQIAPPLVVPSQSATRFADSPRAPASEAAAHPIVKINLPPIGYDVAGAATGAEPLSVATLMLAKETVVQPEWIFHGLVVAAGKHAKAPRAAPSTQVVQPEDSVSARVNNPQKESFWVKLRHFLFGHGARCEGVGCG